MPCSLMHTAAWLSPGIRSSAAWSACSLLQVLTHIVPPMWTGGCRAVPGRFTATYLLLLGIQRGYKAQAAAVDWILGKDWPQAAGDAQTLDGNPADAPGGSGCNPASRDGDETSSMDTQQLLGHDAAEAIHLADTATSSSNPPATQVQRQPAAQPDVPAAQQPAPVAPAGDAALDSGDLLSARVWLTLRAFVAACQAHKAEACWPDALGALAVTTGLPPADLGNMLDTLQKALVRRWTALGDGKGPETVMPSHARTLLTCCVPHPHLHHTSHIRCTPLAPACLSYWNSPGLCTLHANRSTTLVLLCSTAGHATVSSRSIWLMLHIVAAIKCAAYGADVGRLTRRPQWICVQQHQRSCTLFFHGPSAVAVIAGYWLHRVPCSG
jgi:hypothetical protein